jgi:hypothetical protein
LAHGEWRIAKSRLSHPLFAARYAQSIPACGPQLFNPNRDRNLAFAYCTNFQREAQGIGPRGAALSVAAAGGKSPDWPE